MSTTTTNLELIKPEATDNVKLSDINENMDKIDATMSGWIPLTGTFTYSNSTTITTSADCTSFLSAGMKLKCTNGTVKMSVIKSVTSTTIVLESSVLASGAITDVYFSTGQVPYGYSAGDFVIERGTSGVWTYEKWQSGKATCIGTSSLTTNLSSFLDGSTYTEQRDIDLPTGLFIEVPKGKCDCDGSLLSTNLYRANSTTSYMRIILYSTYQYTNEDILVTLILEGKWRN